MADIKLFRIGKEGVAELQGSSVAVEKSLQSLIERHLPGLLGVRFLASEHPTGKTHGGRIDTLGIDEDGSPVIIEYKRAVNENVINQGLFYIDWLVDHKAEFQLLVMRSLGAKTAESIEWSSPRLLCMAGDFTRYDVHAVQQMNRNIELVRYRRYEDDLILFELLTTPGAEATHVKSVQGQKEKYKTINEQLAQVDEKLRDRFEALKAFLLALGDDVQMKVLSYYIAFKRFKNFACVELRPQASRLLVFVKVDPSTIKLEEGFLRDVRKIGHFGTGDLEITIGSDSDLERAKAFLVQSYEAS